MRIILASKSPRRRELLSVITSEFDIETADVDERAIEEGILAKPGDMIEKSKEMVLELSKTKAQAILAKHQGEDVVVIGSDTCVVTSDEIMGKPIDKEDARRILRKLSAAEHYVLTGVTICSLKGTESFYVSSAVQFNSLDAYQEELIERYINTDEPYDKAGAYGIQGNGMLLIEGIKGDYYNIMGLPVNRVARELKKMGII